MRSKQYERISQIVPSFIINVSGRGFSGVVSIIDRAELNPPAKDDIDKILRLHLIDIIVEVTIKLESG